ncbi:kinase domain protein (macronuclear) [Tetrahymena thermophila SB210]|uniref:Kinase domain protein n=1 Tax=Tetrahymena thermophila (strain SB210) TaxID=312017 RepID=Q22PI0_TETTS|nr:kinase domain protein [Tetrahymena thermophila SB210]EAR87129.2 kinase domain protein [Tetrahymena thermophila SB210]|eukprot:XP_001007374.2 kinase domain protein [Tetrahymena thermophila SB210]
MQIDLQQRYSNLEKLLSSDLTCSNSLQLVLRKSDISENQVKHIAQKISKLVDIRSLKIDLSENILLEEATKSLSKAIGQCINLQELELIFFSSGIGQEGLKSIGLNLSNCSKLISLKLDLIKNSIYDQGVIELVNGLRSCQSLTNLSIDLYMNHVSSLGLLEILKFLGSHKKIEIFTLNLHYNNLGDEEKANQFVQTGESMCCSNLKTMNLYLSRSYFGIIAIAYIASFIGSQINLTNLHFEIIGSKILDQHKLILAKSLKNCQKLVYLYLDLSPSWYSHQSFEGEKLFKLVNKMKRLVQKKVVF